MNKKEIAEEMKNQTWGTEWEMSRINCHHCAQVVAQYYHDKYGTQIEVFRGNGWGHQWGARDNKGRTWWTHVDGSVREDGEGCCELTTPIMTYDDIEDAQGVLRLLRENGAVSGQRWGCGLHIHIGAFNTTDNSDDIQTAKSLRNLANMMKSHEDILIRAINISQARYSGGYCSTISDGFIQALNRAKPTTVEGVKSVYHRFHNRYTMLNFDSLDDNKTVEFRLFEFHKNMHAGEFKAYLQLCMAMCAYAKHVRYSSANKVDMSNERYAMVSWLKNLGLIGEEFKTARKMLTKRLSGDTAYKSGRVPTDDDLVELDG